MTNILLTSVGRRAELVKVLKQAYRDLQIVGHIIGTDIDPLAPALHMVDRPYIVPRIDSTEYIETLIRICDKENVSAIIPLLDPDISRLSQSRTLIELSGARPVVISPHSAEITSDKWATYQFFLEIGVSTPRSWLPDTVPPNQDFPLFVKPRRGSASKNTYRANNERELDFFSHYVQDAIVQEYLPGPEITNDVLCDFAGRVLTVVSRKRIEVRGGEVTKGVTIRDMAIIETCVTIAQQLNTIGPITIQCIIKDNKPFFTEINARLGGGIPLSIAAGVNIPKMLLALCAGVETQIPPIGEYEVDLFVSRFDNSIFLSSRDRDEMAKHRI